jgi:uncharacterized protein
MSERRGNWIPLYPSGGKYWPHDPRPEDILIEDVAHHLSMICRFTGAVKRFYSDAEHSVHVSRITGCLPGLMHDGPEYVITDVAKPTKERLPDYQQLEAENWRCFAARFGLPVVMRPEIKLADRRVYYAERMQLVTSPWNPADYLDGIDVPDLGHLGLPPEEAEQLFLDRYHELGGKYA